MKVNKEKYRLAVQKMQNSQIRRKNVADYFLNESKLHREWLHELAEAYKQKKDFPMIPIVTLAQHYVDFRDREVAAFAGMMLKTVCPYEHIQAINQMFQDKPWEWFRNRCFVGLSLGDQQNQTTAGVTNWRWAQFFQQLYDACFTPYSSEFTPAKYRWVRSLSQTFSLMKRDNDCNSYQVLSDMVGSSIPFDQTYYFRILLMLFGTDDGFGFGHEWCIPDEDLKCPIVPEIRLFAKTWFPNYNQFGTLDEAISLFGFKRDCDFLYAYLGYQRLLKKNWDGCRYYEKRYLRWYERGSKIRRYEWSQIRPEINL